MAQQRNTVFGQPRNEHQFQTAMKPVPVSRLALDKVELPQNASPQAPKTQRPSPVKPQQDIQTGNASMTLFPSKIAFLEGITKARSNFIDYEKKTFEDQIRDMKETIGINKQMINDLFMAQPDLDKELLAKLNKENQVLQDKLVQLYSETRKLASEKLVAEQVGLQGQSTKMEDEEMLHKRIEELKDQIGRKELFLQQREKKWADVTNLITPLFPQNPKIENAFTELKLHTGQDTPSKKKITIKNVVVENIKLKRKLQNKNQTINSLKRLILAKQSEQICTDCLDAPMEQQQCGKNQSDSDQSVATYNECISSSQESGDSEKIIPLPGKKIKKEKVNKPSMSNKSYIEQLQKKIVWLEKSLQNQKQLNKNLQKTHIAEVKNSVCLRKSLELVQNSLKHLLCCTNDCQDLNMLILQSQPSNPSNSNQGLKQFQPLSTVVNAGVQSLLGSSREPEGDTYDDTIDSELRNDKEKLTSRQGISNPGNFFCESCMRLPLLQICMQRLNSHLNQSLFNFADQDHSQFFDAFFVQEDKPIEIQADHEDNQQNEEDLQNNNNNSSNQDNNPFAVNVQEVKKMKQPVNDLRINLSQIEEKPQVKNANNSSANESHILKALDNVGFFGSSTSRVKQQTQRSSFKIGNALGRLSNISRSKKDYQPPVAPQTERSPTKKITFDSSPKENNDQDNKPQNDHMINILNVLHQKKFYKEDYDFIQDRYCCYWKIKHQLKNMKNQPDLPPYEDLIKEQQITIDDLDEKNS